MKLFNWFIGLFRKKTNSFYDVRAEHEQIAREFDEWRRKEIMRNLQAPAPKSAEEFQMEIAARPPQALNLQMATIGNDIKHFAVEPEEFAKLNLNETINTNQDNTTDLIMALHQWQSRQ